MKKTVGFIGLGNMGLNMVLHLLDKGYDVHAWNRSPEPRAEAAKGGAKVYEELNELTAALPKPRIIFSMVAAEAVDEVLEKVSGSLEKDDIFIDGVNSHFKDSIRRGEKLAQKGIYFIDCGVSGGIKAAREGACIMAGGDPGVFKTIEPMIADMATPGGYGYFGPSGAGHYVKMVHNAIEYAMQALGEGMNIIKASKYKEADLTKLTDVWSHASIIAGNLVMFLHEFMKKDPELKTAPAAIGSLGTGKWAVNEALDLGVPVTNIAASVFNRFSSRGNDEFARKVISALRAEFGGHNENERDHK